MTEIPALYGSVKILSLADVANPYVGITPNGGSFATVSLGKTDQDWNITSQPNGKGLRFSIGTFPYTGLGNGETVVATTEQSQDVAWYADYVVSLEAYVIYPSDNAGSVWTFQDPTAADSPVLLQPRVNSASQGFKAQSLDSMD